MAVYLGIKKKPLLLIPSLRPLALLQCVFDKYQFSCNRPLQKCWDADKVELDTSKRSKRSTRTRLLHRNLQYKNLSLNWNWSVLHCFCYCCCCCRHPDVATLNFPPERVAGCTAWLPDSLASWTVSQQPAWSGCCIVRMSMAVAIERGV